MTPDYAAAAHREARRDRHRPATAALPRAIPQTARLRRTLDPDRLLVSLFPAGHSCRWASQRKPPRRHEPPRAADRIMGSPVGTNPERQRQLPKPERIANLEFFLTHDAPAVRGYRLDRPAALPRRYAQALADELGHTVFLLGLDDDRWWAYRHDADEATSAFFVGLSRAAQRLIFTRRFGGPAGRPSPVHNGAGSGGGAGRRRACDAERTGCQRGSRVAPADPGARGRPGPAPGAAGDLDRRRC